MLLFIKEIMQIKIWTDRIWTDRYVELEWSYSIIHTKVYFNYFLIQSFFVLMQLAWGSGHVLNQITAALMIIL